MKSIRLIRTLPLLLLLLFSACDPAQRIIIENKTNETANVTFVFNSGTPYYQFEQEVSSDTLFLTLNPVPDQKFYLFGIGSWKGQHLEELIRSVSYIELRSMNSTQIFEGENQVRAFFKSRIKGRFKEQIQISIE